MKPATPLDTSGPLHHDPPIFEKGAPGRSGASLPPCDVPEREVRQALPAHLCRSRDPGLPEVSEVEATRHYTRLSRWNYAIDIGMYPLGSCTMKYNPKINERAARLDGFAQIHPAMPPGELQGALALMYGLERALCEITGLSRATLQPAAGAHGELAGLMMIRSYHRDRGQRPSRVLVPDSAHGTNPASCTLNGFSTIPVPTGRGGTIETDAVRAACAGAAGDIAGIMITNPSTLGLFEEKIDEIAEVVHAAGGLVYMDGANLNALLGRFRPGDHGVDCLHINLHKTFTTPHGGGGPGSGPVAVVKALEPFLPVPLVEKSGAGYRLETDRKKSIGRVRAFFGNFGMHVRAYTYIREMGAAGLRRASEMAVLNANYIRARLAPLYGLPFDRPCMHEVVLWDRKLKRATGVETLDVAKRLMDYGFHPPTIYFPLPHVISGAGALMIEPTETETPESLDEFCAAMAAIAEEAARTPAEVKSAPHLAPLERLDEARAARKPKLRWTPPGR